MANENNPDNNKTQLNWKKGATIASVLAYIAWMFGNAITEVVVTKYYPVVEGYIIQLVQ